MMTATENMVRIGWAFKVLRETERAMLVEVDEAGLHDRKASGYDNMFRDYWLPKSQVRIEDGVLFVPYWLAKKNHMRW